MLCGTPLKQVASANLGCSGIPHHGNIRLGIKGGGSSISEANQLMVQASFYPHWTERAINASSWLVLAN